MRSRSSACKAGGIATTVALAATGVAGLARAGIDFAAARAAGSVLPELAPADTPNLGDLVGASCPSFAAGTRVVLVDGSTKAIDKVAVGDRVRATDSATGDEVVRTVTELHLNHDTDMTDVAVRDGAGKEATVHTTQHHRFWDDSRGGWVDAGALLSGDRLHTDDGMAVTVAGVRSWDAAQWMDDLTVDGGPHLLCCRGQRARSRTQLHAQLG